MRRDGRASFVFALCVLLLAGSLLPAPAGRVAAARQESAGEPVVARISVGSRQELERLVRLGLDLLETREGDDLFVITSEERVRRLRSEGWRVSVDEPKTALLRGQRPGLRQTRAGNTQAGAAQSVGAASVMGGYLTVPEMRAFLDDRAARHPNLAKVFVYGDSWERIYKAPGGHELFGIELTNKQRTNPAGKPTLLPDGRHPRA
jgi:hypothetical protein